MSHELRTPLNAILGYADLLSIGVRGSITGEQHEDLERIRRSGQHLLALINDVLNYAKVDAGRVEYRLTSVPLAPEIAALEALIGPQLRTRALEYVHAECSPTLAVRADRDKLRQIVLNLLGNSVKYTPRGGRIEVRCELADADRVAIRVRDSGVGIATEKLATIFDPFVQVGRSFSRPADGVGLGLSISRDLARGMGGELSVASEVGRGSEFTLTLPRG
jgi:signal transduction histidine kinase